MPILSIIAALSAKDRVIGLHNQLPWHMPADLLHFKLLTLHKPILMGRKTFESIGKPLPHRQNIILTRNKNYSASGALIVESIDEALSLVKDQAELMIIGGEQLFKLLLPRAQLLHLTFIHGDFTGDTFFPDIHSDEWEEISRTDLSKDEKNPYDYSFVSLQRKKLVV